MCGICGIIDMRKQGRANPEIVREMADLMRHRGPDGDGFYSVPDVALGMRRLSIIDVAGSDQPLYNEEGSIALVFNGEIYNYCELQADLLQRGHQLRTAGDGETLIHLYETFGLDLFAHLRGMYAFALWDSYAERLVLAGDHIGMKPLYLHERDGKLLFASEVKALFADQNTPRAMNMAALDTFLTFGYMIGEETLFDGVRRLPPGHALVVEHGEARLQQYWTFRNGYLGRGRPEAASFDGDANAVVETARALLQDSVRIHLRSDVPLGLFLSGGVDSASMLALMSQGAAGRVKTYSVGFDVDTPYDELARARQIAQHFNADHHELVIDSDDWWSGFERYIYYHDEPNANESAISTLLLAEMTARDVKVVLTGLGGDELFGGYPHHHAIPELLHRQETWARGLASGFPRAVLSRGLEWIEGGYPRLRRYRLIGALPYYLPRFRSTLLPRAEGLLRMASFDGLAFSDNLRNRLYSPPLMEAWRASQHKERAYSDILAQSWQPDPYNTAQALVINTWLAGNALLLQDKVTMAASLEARVPLFDPVLLDFAARVPPAVRMKSNKFVLREAMRDCLPDFALERPKQPFSTPIAHWFDAGLKERIQAVLLDGGARTRDLFNRAALEKLLGAHFARRERHDELAFRLLNLELWAQRFEMAVN